MKEESRTMSELIREALRNYMEEREWLRAIRYERLKAARGRARTRKKEDRQMNTKLAGRLHPGGPLRQGLQ